MRKNTGGSSVSSTTQTSSKHTTQIDSTTTSSSMTEVASLSLPNNNDDMTSSSSPSPQLDKDFVHLATKHYYARLLIKMGKWSYAEKLYRRIIDELTAEGADDQECDHTKLAVSTLLLALHVQRTGDVKATRAVFLNFFRRVNQKEEERKENDNEEVHKCSCSAKVLQAYALFEMKNGHSAKSLEIIQRAVRMDESLHPVLGWKQFRDAAAGREYVPTISFSKRRSGPSSISGSRQRKEQ